MSEDSAVVEQLSLLGVSNAQIFCRNGVRFQLPLTAVECAAAGLPEDESDEG
jgi:hypothetical protein